MEHGELGWFVETWCVRLSCSSVCRLHQFKSVSFGEVMDDQIDEFSAASVGDPHVYLDERRRVRNVRVDWSGVDMEDSRGLKRRRAGAKAVLTKAITHISDTLVVGSDVMEVQTMQERLIRVFSSFKEACVRYEDTLVDDIDVEESTACVPESRYQAAKDRIALWL